MNGVRRIRNEKLREHQYREGYGRCLESKIGRGGGIKRVWLNDLVKAAAKWN